VLHNEWQGEQEQEMGLQTCSPHISHERRGFKGMTDGASAQQSRAVYRPRLVLLSSRGLLAYDTVQWCVG
jgi:hypothetical protein